MHTHMQTPDLPVCYWIVSIWMYLFSVGHLRRLSINWIGVLALAKVVPEVFYWTTYFLEYNGPGLLWVIHSLMVVIWVLYTYEYI